MLEYEKRSSNFPDGRPTQYAHAYTNAHGITITTTTATTTITTATSVVAFPRMT